MEFFDQTFLSQGEDVSVSPDNFMVSAAEQLSSWTAVNQPTGSSPSGTVSPSDLALEPSLTMSAPSSTAFPNLNTPGSHVLDSPYWGYNGSSSLDTSPLHPDGQLDSGLDGDDWASQPLFPSDPHVDPFAQPVAIEAANEASVVPEYTSGAASPMVRQKSSGSPGRPMSSGRKPSEVAGVKPNKSRKPLPEIVIKEDDAREIAKRKKNTAAARKSRERKLERFQEQEAEIERLAEMNEEQKSRIEKMRRYIVAMGGNPQDAEIF